jgi:rare lipoprotein A (peptidoglycan hydrolase)
MSSAQSKGLSGLRFPERGKLGLAAAFLSLGIALTSAQVVNPLKQPVVVQPTKVEGLAVWYNVPPNSLAKRRAGKDELTAAHNRLPLGAKVRVTHVANGKSVVVRITDRGITDRHVLIDLCKEAAAELGMLREGSAHVRLEILPDEKAPASKTKAASW